MRYRQRLGLWVILASATLTVMAGATIAPALNLIREGVGADPGLAGLIITTHALFFALSSPLIGKVIDRWGTRRPFILGLVIYGLSGGSGLFISSFGLLLASRAILGLGVAAITITISVMIVNLYEGHERDRVMGLRGSANSFGGIIYPLIGGFLGTIAWNLPFSVYLVGLALGAVSLATIPETHPIHRGPSSGTAWRHLSENRILLAVFGMFFLSMLFLYVIVVFIPQYLALLGISSSLVIGLYISAMATVAGVISLSYGRIRRALPYRSLVLVAYLSAAVGLVSISLSQGPVPILVSVLIFGIGHGIMMPLAVAWVGDVASQEFRGTMMSYLTMAGQVGQFASPAVFGPLSIALGMQSVFMITGMISVMVLVSALAWLR